MKKNVVFVLIFLAVKACADVRLVLTAALTDAYYSFRKQQYVASFNQLYNYGFTPASIYIIEAVKRKGPTFLEAFSQHVFYATVNDQSLVNKGLNEITTLFEGLKYYNFDPDDIVIKMTGRYYLLSDYCLKTVYEKQNQYDVFVKRDGPCMVRTFIFAMRVKYLMELLSEIDIYEYEKKGQWVEHAFAQYINRNIGKLRVCFLDHLDIALNRYGQSTSPHDAPNKVMIF